MIGPRLVLTGGWDTDSLADGIAHLLAVTATAADRPMLLLPHAWPAAKHEAYHDRFCEWLAPHGVAPSAVTTWTDLHDRTASDLAQFRAVFIGGGNTFALWHEFACSGFVPTLRAHLASGAWLGSNSAGSLILGQDFRYAHDPNDVGLATFTGMQQVGRYAAWAHYTPDPHDAEIADFFATSGIPVLAMANHGAVEVIGNVATVVSAQPVYVVTDSVIAQLHRGDILDLVADPRLHSQ
ncbi:MAG: Type 1 glutamine amidotransferase-like domain-containing protein [Myxococcales bacterium]|nr:Type 1 glutamine amidotransferase-like domain-containing protein [Myxococcales bacterium]